MPCSNRGECKYDTGVCECFDNYFGSACSLYTDTSGDQDGANALPALIVNVNGPAYASSALLLASTKAKAPDFNHIECIADSKVKFYIRGDGTMEATSVNILSEGGTIYGGGVFISSGGLSTHDDGVTVDSISNVFSIGSIYHQYTGELSSSYAAVQLSTLSTSSSHYILEASHGGSTKFSISGNGLVKVMASGAVLTGGVTVNAGGVAVSGGMSVLSNGMLIKAGGIRVTKGMSIQDTGIKVFQSGSRIYSGGMTISNSGMKLSAGGLFVTAGGLFVSAVGGLSINAGGLKVTDGMTVFSSGINVKAGGVTVANSGVYVRTSGVSIANGGMSVVGGATVANQGVYVGAGGGTVAGGGLYVSNGLSIGANGLSVTGGISITTAVPHYVLVSGGLTIFSSGVSVKGGLTVEDTGASVAGGMSVGSGTTSNIGGSVSVTAGGLQAITMKVLSGGVFITNGLTVHNSFYIQYGFPTIAPTVAPTARPTTSDRRLKTDIEPITDALGKVSRLQGVYFRWIQNERSGLRLDNRRHVGLIAQEVQSVVPEAVGKSPRHDKYLGVDYPALIPVLLEAVRDLSDRILSLNFRAAKGTTTSNEPDLCTNRTKEIYTEIADVKKKIREALEYQRQLSTEKELVQNNLNSLRLLTQNLM